jgi:hypothetical protein
VVVDVINIPPTSDPIGNTIRFQRGIQPVKRALNTNKYFGKCSDRWWKTQWQSATSKPVLNQHSNIKKSPSSAVPTSGPTSDSSASPSFGPRSPSASRVRPECVPECVRSVSPVLRKWESAFPVTSRCWFRSSSRSRSVGMSSVSCGARLV